ncbi:MAG TPA: alpha/beta hydrolase [Solirubrobacterales bacterium]|nr:alpha/beta hydrolase [Solirubrobacterales bacterium]
MNKLKLRQGTIRYRESGEGPPIVFVHGLLVDGRLWRKVTPLLEDRFRCIVPDLPLGSHREPMDPDADLSPPGLARIVAGFMEALDLEDVTLVANDTGGAISQITAAHHPERIGRLLLTNCDAFENFLPPAFRPMQWAARVPGGLTGMMAGMRFAPLRRLPNAYGRLIKRDFADAPTRDWVDPYLTNKGVRRDTIKVLRAIDPKHTFEAAERLREFDRPALLAWAVEDRFFKLSFAERLARTIRGARLEKIEDSYTFVSEDQPERLAELTGTFAGSVSSPAASASG